MNFKSGIIFKGEGEVGYNLVFSTLIINIALIIEALSLL